MDYALICSSAYDSCVMEKVDYDMLAEYTWQMMNMRGGHTICKAIKVSFGSVPSSC